MYILNYAVHGITWCFIHITYINYSMLCWVNFRIYIWKEVYLGNFRVTDGCHGQHSHHRVNHIIMSTTHRQVIGKCNVQQIGNAWVQVWKDSRARNPAFLLVKWMPGSPQYYRVSVCMARSAKVVAASQHFWKMGSAKCAPDCSESLISHKTRYKLKGSEQRGIVPARMLLDLLRRSWQAGLQLERAKGSSWP